MKPIFTATRKGNLITLREEPDAALARWKFDAEEDDRLAIAISAAWEDEATPAEIISWHGPKLEYPEPGVVIVKL